MFLLTFLSLVTFGNPAIIDGYTNHFSVFPGDSVTLYLNADTVGFKAVTLFDLKGTEVASFSMNLSPQHTPGPEAYEHGFNYRKTATVKIPELPSGVYLWDQTIPMIIKSRHPKIIILYSSNTENAYATTGGKSLYDYNSTDTKKASKVSFLRPISLPRYSEAFLRWFAEQPYQDVGYICDMDMDDYSEIKRASLLLIVGHSEYWTRNARNNFDKFVSEGKNAIVLSGNTMWWQVRYNNDRNQLICYKSAEDDKIKSPALKTTRWNDPTLGYPITKSIGVEFPLAGYGTKTDNGWDGYKILTESPLLENAELKPGEILPCMTDEYDGTPLLGFNNDSIPVINRQALGFEKIEIIGYDRSVWSDVAGVATWIVFKASKKSGIVINTASTNWCSDNGIGQSDQIKTITNNMIQKLLKKENVFSPNLGKETMPVVSH
jgi:hypothetical protein